MLSAPDFPNLKVGDGNRVCLFCWRMLGAANVPVENLVDDGVVSLWKDEE
jgi:hypothetical protein